MVTPGVISDVGIALLHYKLAGDFRNQFREDEISNNRVGGCKLRYQAYAEFFESWAGSTVDLATESVRYSSSRTLVEAGLLAAPVGDFV